MLTKLRAGLKSSASRLPRLELRQRLDLFGRAIARFDWGLLDLTQLVAPNDCLGCAAPGLAPLCQNCLSDLERIALGGCRRCHNPEVSPSAATCPWCDRLRPRPAAICSFFAYRHLGRVLFHLIKFQGYWRLIPKILSAELDQLNQVITLDEDACLVPIPESTGRKFSRFFNPAAEIAHAVSRASGLPVRQVLSLKLKAGHQVGLSASERRRNVRDRFKVQGKVPRAVILVDDVLTTGATLESAQKALQAAGVEKVAWLTLFRTL